MLAALEILQEKIDYSFSQINWLKEALTHPSFRHESNKINYDYQRLEFLGDSVLQILITEYLFKEHPEQSEGELSQARSALVREESLAECAKAFKLDSFLILGKSELREKGQKKSLKDSIIADTFEALLGAIYLDSGSHLEDVRKFYLKVLLETWPKPIELCKQFNPKGSLQEFLQSHSLATPKYIMIAEEGEKHAPTFTVTCTLSKQTLAEGSGASLKKAQEDAARKALTYLKNLNDLDILKLEENN